MTRTQPNPLTRSGLYFPGAQTCYAYHAILLPDALDEEEAAEAFLSVWQTGALVSAGRRGGGGRGIHVEDEAASDDEYVFLSLGQPLPETASYAFAFDPLALVRRGAQVGLLDLMPLYERFWESVDSEEEFQERAQEAQAVLRWRGAEAESWLNWACNRPGVQSRPEARLARARRYLRQQLGRYEYLRVAAVGGPRQRARDLAELLVRERLPLAQAVGVIYQKVWFTLPDFVGLTGVPPGGELEAVLAGVGDLYRESGFPYRCPLCGDPLVRGDLASVLEADVWGPEWDCESCGESVALA